jgi:excisionase family DNA binding protein
MATRKPILADEKPGCDSVAVVAEPIRALSVREIAERYGVKKQIVLAWIKNGELRAIDVRARDANRPRFKVLPADLIAFEAKRVVRPQLVTATHRRRAHAESTATPIKRRW